MELNVGASWQSGYMTLASDSSTTKSDTEEAVDRQKASARMLYWIAIVVLGLNAASNAWLVAFGRGRAPELFALAMIVYVIGTILVAAILLAAGRIFSDAWARVELSISAVLFGVIIVQFVALIFARQIYFFLTPGS